MTEETKENTKNIIIVSDDTNSKLERILAKNTFATEPMYITDPYRKIRDDYKDYVIYPKQGSKYHK